MSVKAQPSSRLRAWQVPQRREEWFNKQTVDGVEHSDHTYSDDECIFISRKHSGKRKTAKRYIVETLHKVLFIIKMLTIASLPILSLSPRLRTGLLGAVSALCFRRILTNFVNNVYIIQVFEC